MQVWYRERLVAFAVTHEALVFADASLLDGGTSAPMTRARTSENAGDPLLGEVEAFLREEP